MKTIKVKILENGTQAKECNPLGDTKPHPVNWMAKGKGIQNNWDDLRAWDEAEASLRTFEIADMILSFGDGQDYDEFDVKFAIMQLPVGSIHNAELLPNGKIKIID